MPDATLTKGLGAVAAAALGCWAFLDPPVGGWLFAAAEFGFLAWLGRRARSVDGAALVAGAREALEPDEAELARRYPLYFARPGLARECASVLSAIGLVSLILVSWLLYKQQWPPAIIIGVFLFAVARLTRHLSPVLALRLAAGKGDREALRLLSAHDGAARKLLLHGIPQPEADGKGRR